MARAFVRLLLTLGVVGATYVARERGQLVGAESWIRNLWDQQMKRLDAAELEELVLTSMDEARLAKQQSTMERDEELHGFVHEQFEKRPDTTLSDLLDTLQKCKPAYSRVAAISTRGLSTNGLKEEILKWRDAAEPCYNLMAVVAKPGLSRLGLGAVLIVAERLPVLTPEAINSTKATIFYSNCAHCGKGAQCEITRRNYTISLECPHCKHTTTILAADLRGQMHYANEFLTGYAPPAHFPKGLSKMNEMLIIWRAVGDICHYKKDQEDIVNDPGDAWQFGLETQKLGTGDCEDSAIMLADWLASRGFEARVALGRYSERGGHAWVVVKLDEKEYLLESTMPDTRAGHVPLASEVGSRYVPEAMLDYNSIYVRQDPRESWDGGYFQAAKWIRIVPRNRATAPTELANARLRAAITRNIITAAAP